MAALAGEADIKLPDLTQVKFDGLGGMSGLTLMYLGIVICLVGAVFGLVQYQQTKALQVHDCMAKVSNSIWETCKTYLITQGKFLAILWILIAICMTYYFMGLSHESFGKVLVILACSILGILGSYGVAWFGIRINTTSNSRAAFSALRGDPLATLGIPLRSGMSVGLQHQIDHVVEDHSQLNWREDLPAPHDLLSINVQCEERVAVIKKNPVAIQAEKSA